MIANIGDKMAKGLNINDEQALDTYMIAEFDRREQAFREQNMTEKANQVASSKQVYLGKGHPDKKLAYRALESSKAVGAGKSCCMIS